MRTIAQIRLVQLQCHLKGSVAHFLINLLEVGGVHNFFMQSLKFPIIGIIKQIVCHRRLDFAAIGMQGMRISYHCRVGIATQTLCGILSFQPLAKGQFIIFYGTTHNIPFCRYPHCRRTKYLICLLSVCMKRE